MTDHTIQDLRRRLFETIDGVKDGSIDIERARMIGDISQVIVNTARVEVEYLKATGGGESTFIDSAVGADHLPNGITAITRHRIGG